MMPLVVVMMMMVTRVIAVFLTSALKQTSIDILLVAQPSTSIPKLQILVRSRLRECFKGVVGSAPEFFKRRRRVPQGLAAKDLLDVLGVRYNKRESWRANSSQK